MSDSEPVTLDGITPEEVADAPNKRPPATAVGTEEQLTEQSIGDVLPTFGKWQDQIASRIANASSADDALAALNSWASSAESDADVADAIYETVLKANMGGQLQVRTVEAYEDAPAVTLAKAMPVAPFLSLPFEEAIADFRARQIVTPEQYAAMDAAARQRSFTATQFATQALREEAYRGVLSALENGTTLRDFAQQLRTGEASLGVTPSDPSYIETIFRTNIASAYSAGRLAQMQSPEVLQLRPWVQFRAIIDGRTTTPCKFCNGAIFNRQTDPGWVKYNPPLHFNCRSTAVLVSRIDPSDSRIRHSSEMDPRCEPMAGWGGQPSLSL